MSTVLGVRIDSLSFGETVRKVSSFIEQKKITHIVTVNPEIIMAAQKDRGFFEILNKSELNVPDGFGLMLAARFLGQALKERITGVDLSWAILKLAEEKGYKVFLLGGKPGVVQKAAENILRVHPNVKIVGVSSANPDDKDIIDTINKVQPDILLVAYGAPKQEKFIYNLVHRSPNTVHRVPLLSIGVGGTFDYIAGTTSYAPKWLRKIGLEWLYRLFTQPKRFNRIITATIRFPWAVLKSKIKHD